MPSTRVEMSSTKLLQGLILLWAPLVWSACPALQAPANGNVACTQSPSGGNLATNTRCDFTCNTGWALGSVWSWSRYATDRQASYATSHPSAPTTHDLAPHHPQHYEQFRADSDTQGKYNAANRSSLAAVTKRTCSASGEWSGQAPRCWSTQQAQGCVSGVFPKCGSRTSRISPETRVTIIGRNFGTAMSVTFNDGNILKPGKMIAVKPDEIVVAIPPYLEHNDIPFPYETYDTRHDMPYTSQYLNKSAKGTLIVTAGGVPLQDCRDVDFAHARRVFEFSYTVGWPANPPLYATDYVNNRIIEVDPDTGISTNLIDAVEGFELKRPYGIDIGPDGALYVACAGPSHGRILRYNTTGQFLGVWANVPGEPRGIRWRHDRLYVSSWDSNRVIAFRHHATRVNFDKGGNTLEMQNIVGSYLGPFTQDLSYESRNGVQLFRPWELRFHALAGHLKLFVSSTESGHILQFNGTDGRFERVYTQMHTKYATGFAFGFSRISTDLYVVGAHSGGAVARFDSSTGEFKAHYKDNFLKRSGGMVSHEDSIYVTCRDEIRQYSQLEGKLIRVSTKLQGAEFSFITVAAQCN